MMMMNTDFIVTSSHLTWPLSSSSSSSAAAAALSSSSSRRNAYHHLHLCRSPWPGAGARTSTRTGRSYHPLSIYAISSNDFKTGTSIEFDGSPWKILEFLHVKPGKGAAFVRTKLKNYITGNTMEKTFRAGESVDEARVEKDVKQFTYKEGDQYVFMDMVTYEESRLNESDIGDKNKWLKEGMDCNVLAWNGRVIDVEVPINVKLKIVETDPGVKGDTAQGGGSKPATLETGAVVNVPLFVNSGDTILVDTRTGSYLSRA